MKKRRNRLDEMQEQKMLRIEHNGCWLAFWGLLAVTLGQFILYGEERAELFAGECIVFMCLAIYIVGACIKNGIWDRTLRPSPKVNLCASAMAGVGGGAVRFLSSYSRHGDIRRALAIGCIIFVYIFVVCFLCMSLVLFIYKKRKKWLETEEDREQPEK